MRNECFAKQEFYAIIVSETKTPATVQSTPAGSILEDCAKENSVTISIDCSAEISKNTPLLIVPSFAPSIEVQ